jgi:hypothetical protein
VQKFLGKHAGLHGAAVAAAIARLAELGLWNVGEWIHSGIIDRLISVLGLLGPDGGN